MTSKVVGAKLNHLKQLSLKVGFHMIKQIKQATHLVMPEASATPKAVHALSTNVPIVNTALFDDILSLTTKMRPLDPLSDRYAFFFFFLRTAITIYLYCLLSLLLI